MFIDTRAAELQDQNTRTPRHRPRVSSDEKLHVLNDDEKLAPPLPCLSIPGQRNRGPFPHPLSSDSPQHRCKGYAGSQRPKQLGGASKLLHGYSRIPRLVSLALVNPLGGVGCAVTNYMGRRVGAIPRIVARRPPTIRDISRGFDS